MVAAEIQQVLVRNDEVRQWYDELPMSRGDMRPPKLKRTMVAEGQQELDLVCELTGDDPKTLRPPWSCRRKG